MKKIFSSFVWILVALLGMLAYGIIAFRRGEPLNAIWLICAAACTYAIAYRFYSKWIATHLLMLNDKRATPCHVHEDGRDFVKTNKWIVFGHHFAAISGPGPLVGPVLAAQFGYLPSSLWILIGVVLGGAVQDFMILFCSIRRDGKSLGEMVKEEIGTAAGSIALLAILAIMVILIAVLGLVVVKALAGSPWGTFTITATIPIALMMGIYLRFIRPGKVLEVTVIGIALLLISVWAGKWVYENPTLSAFFNLGPKTLAFAIIAYGLAASALPVWLLLAPRDYLSTFMKLGTIIALALGIIIVLPSLHMPPLTRFIDGTGPIFAGKLFPFCFITIACGAISGFHSLIASGTTPKLIARESYARFVGYGSMLMESGVAIMALIAACTLDPGIYFAINSPAAAVGATADMAVQTISNWGFPITSESMSALAKSIGENTLFGRAGGAPTLALGMANIFSQAMGNSALLSLWYHFAIMFEALFILTTVDAGTRVGRFLLQAFLGQFHKGLGNTKSYAANIFASVLLVSAWGYFLVQGVLDPQGGINSLWPLFGIANQLLAVVALCLASTVLIKMHKEKYIWVTLIPLLTVGCITFTAALEKIFHASPKIGFLAGGRALQKALAEGKIPIDKISSTHKSIFNAFLDAGVTAVFLILVTTILLLTAWRWLNIWQGRQARDLRESTPVWLKEELQALKKSQGLMGGLAAFMWIGFALLKHLAGETSLPHPSITKFAKASKHSHSELSEAGLSEGAAWAAKEDLRFQKPKCC